MIGRVPWKRPSSPSESYYPEPTFVAWHIREVFQGEVRYGGSYNLRELGLVNGR